MSLVIVQWAVDAELIGPPEFFHGGLEPRGLLKIQPPAELFAFIASGRVKRLTRIEVIVTADRRRERRRAEDQPSEEP